jgi:hypothetical protein
VKKNSIIKSLVMGLLVFSYVVEADEKYPAADFQPSVVYQDSDYIAKSGQSSASANKSTSSSTASKAVDSKYPASNFEPKVVYNDPGYKHSESSNSSPASNSASVATSEAVSSEPAKDANSSSSYLIGLVIFAVVGFVLFKRKPDSKSESSARIYAKDATGLTGVSRYLNRTAGTGVARYLEKQVKSASSSAATGVAKYMAKQGGSVQATNATAAKTGVEKYMRKRG